jgi:2-dehydropantoate 2-reductase
MAAVKHAVLGAGAIGGLIGTLLSAGGEDVTFIVRHAGLPAAPDTFTVLRQDGSSIEGAVRSVEAITGDDVDVLWISTKATDLQQALQRVRASSPRAVVPLLNGFEHVKMLESVFAPAVIFPATIAVEAERMNRGVFRQLSAFVRLQLPERGRDVLEQAARTLEAQGVETQFQVDERTLIWTKLVFLAPFALTTSASRKAAGFIREDPEWRAYFDEAAAEVASVARTQGATVDSEAAQVMLERIHPDMRSSMLKDLQAGREIEIDAIAGSVVRTGERAGVPVPTLRALISRIQAHP